MTSAWLRQLMDVGQTALHLCGLRLIIASITKAYATEACQRTTSHVSPDAYS